MIVVRTPKVLHLAKCLASRIPDQDAIPSVDLVAGPLVLPLPGDGLFLAEAVGGAVAVDVLEQPRPRAGGRGRGQRQLRVQDEEGEGGGGRAQEVPEAGSCHPRAVGHQMQVGQGNVFLEGIM